MVPALPALVPFDGQALILQAGGFSLGAGAGAAGRGPFGRADRPIDEDQPATSSQRARVRTCARARAHARTHARARTHTSARVTGLGLVHVLKDLPCVCVCVRACACARARLCVRCELSLAGRSIGAVKERAPHAQPHPRPRPARPPQPAVLLGRVHYVRRVYGTAEMSCDPHIQRDPYIVRPASYAYSTIHTLYNAPRKVQDQCAVARPDTPPHPPVTWDCKDGFGRGWGAGRRGRCL